MPRKNRALTRAARTRARIKGLSYQQARDDVIAIHQIVTEDDLTFTEAQDWYDDPANQLLCETCGWTVGMVCPECTGCGCNNVTCTGWRHQNFMDADELEELHACADCGGDSHSDYACECEE